MGSFVWAVIGRRADDRLLDCFARLGAYLHVWRRRIRSRQTLARIDCRTLRDAGIDPIAAQYEIAQPFWIAERRLR